MLPCMLLILQLLRVWCIVWLLVLSDAECDLAKWSLRLLLPKIYSMLERLSHIVFDNAEVAKECYLVDPASSHMLVSKIKPCMCKYELIQTVKLRMAH